MEQHIPLYTKSIAILSLLIEADKRRTKAIEDLQRYDKADAWSPLKLINTRGRFLAEVEKYDAIISRLNRYYARHHRKMSSTLSFLTSELLIHPIFSSGIPVFGEIEGLEGLFSSCSTTGCNYGNEELNAHI